jgi:hypothetical protein
MHCEKPKESDLAFTTFGVKTNFTTIILKTNSFFEYTIFLSTNLCLTLFCCFALHCVFETWSVYAAQANLKLTIFLPQPQSSCFILLGITSVYHHTWILGPLAGTFHIVSHLIVTASLQVKVQRN